ncbi:MAG: AcvB/VirJ family lysyl-phosphatidylglycerol hydrolase [Pseudomonadales bacterium]
MTRLARTLLALALANAASAAAAALAGPAAADVSDLPLVEVPATAGRSDLLAFMVSGDGGWAAIDTRISLTLAAHGVSAVGLNSLRYFWHLRTPEESAQAMQRTLRHYLATWDKRRLLLIGYSRGADVLPFMATRLPPDLAQRVALIVLIGPEPTITWEIRISDWLRGGPGQDAVPVQPEIARLQGARLLCVYGAEEPDSLCPQLPAGLAILDRRAGGHHFDGQFESIAERILAESAAPQAAPIVRDH